jgi:hypothetical protein
MSSNSSSGHIAFPLECRNSSQVNSHSRTLIFFRHGPRIENTVLLLRSADHTEKTSHVSDFEFIGPLPTLDLGGRHRKQSLIYCCVLDRVYRAVAWQRVDQICYNVFQARYMFRKQNLAGRSSNFQFTSFMVCLFLH